ncbi:MAG TPA: hypothetical protein VKU19_12760 [Bryobacteraceae bacterium]|nr:hypothetical protein [Bryobacteraceae bacterium]
MLRIERESDGCATRLLLSGRIQSDGIDCIRSAMSGGCARKILDLNEVTLVDIRVIRFLNRCEEEGVELAGCPPYVREWILRERVAEEADLETAAEGIIRDGRE